MTKCKLYTYMYSTLLDYSILVHLYTCTLVQHICTYTGSFDVERIIINVLVMYTMYSTVHCTVSANLYR